MSNIKPKIKISKAMKTGKGKLTILVHAAFLCVLCLFVRSEVVVAEHKDTKLTIASSNSNSNANIINSGKAKRHRNKEPKNKGKNSEGMRNNEKTNRNNNNPNTGNLKIKYEQPLSLTISGEGVNHISFAPLIVTGIWGDAAEYSGLISDNGRDLFLTSKVEIGDEIALTIEFAGGQMIDLVLCVSEGTAGKIIRFVFDKNKSGQQEDLHEMSAMFEAMSDGAKGKYYVRNEKRKYEFKGNKHIQLTQKAIYRFDKFMGLIIEVKNKGRDAVKIKAENFSRLFKNVRAVQIDDIRLLSKQKVELFLILENKQR